MGDLISIFGKDGFSPPVEMTPDPPETQLIEAMADHGILCSAVVLDGKLHRFGKDKTSWYAAHKDNCPAGAFGDWKLGIQESWIADIGREFSEEERAATMAAIEAAQERRREEESEKHRAAAEKAEAIWESAIETKPDQAYLARKGVGPGPSKMLEDGRLVLPMWDIEGQLCSLQYISPTGEKRFLSGGKVRGSLGFTGNMSGATKYYLAEGFATAMTIHQATGSPVFWSYSAQNMPPVADYVAGLGVPMVIVADNDDTGTGQKYATKAAKATGCQVVMAPEGDVNDYVAGGGDLAQLLGHSSGAWLVPFSEFTQQPAPVRWLVKKWLPQRATAMVFGPSGVGKTFFVLDWALCIASGKNWGDCVVTPAPVAYLAGEGHAGLAGRLLGWSLYHGVKDANMWISRSGCKLDTPDGYNHARVSLEALEVKPGLIVIDTLHRFLSGDENSSQDAGAMLEACDRLGREFNATVLLVHHTGHVSGRARGSTAWKGALDVEVEIGQVEEGELLFAKNKKQKDAEEAPDVFGILHKKIPLPWVDDDGEPVTSAIWREAKPVDESALLIQDELKMLERAWFATGAELVEGVPYVSESGLLNYLENEMGMDNRQLKRAREHEKGLIQVLTNANIMGHHAYGYKVLDYDMQEMLKGKL